jgi:hypothetical protein
VIVLDFNILMYDEKYYRNVLCVVKDGYEMKLRYDYEVIFEKCLKKTVLS